MSDGKLRFLSSEVPDLNPEQCLFHVIPVPMEDTVSYGGGASEGPRAILEASYQLEIFDGLSSPGERGIYTAPAVDCQDGAEKVLPRIEEAVSEALGHGAAPFVLGGEHTVTLGALWAVRNRFGRVGVVQFDAHADLRDTYEGSPYSHACVMRRAVEMGLPLFQIGVRALSPGEHAFRRERNIPHLDARQVALSGIPDRLLPEDFPEQVYVTFDIDGLDPSLIPATGTPEPGGLTWREAMACLEQIAANRTIVGFDLVELAPIPGLHSADYAAARLAYNVMGMIERSRSGPGSSR